jgi:hypothetical protein
MLLHSRAGFTSESASSSASKTQRRRWPSSRLHEQIALAHKPLHSQEAYNFVVYPSIYSFKLRSTHVQLKPFSTWFTVTSSPTRRSQVGVTSEVPAEEDQVMKTAMGRRKKRSWDLRSSGMLRSVERCLLKYVSGQNLYLLSWVKQPKALVEGIDRWFRNVGT